MRLAEEGGANITVGGAVVAIVATLTLALWAGFIPFDVVVKTQGEIIPATQAQKIVHLEGGVISEILVADGDLVNAGQSLIRLDDTEARKHILEMETRHARLAMLAAQLKALGGDENPDFSFALPKFKESVDNELLIFASLKKLTTKRHRVLSDRVAATREKLKNITQQEQDLAKKSELLEEELQLRQDLFKKGLTPKKVFQDAKKQVERAHLDLADLARERKSTARVLDTVEKHAAELPTRLRERALDELTVLTGEMDALDKALEIQKKQFDRLTITAPVKAIIRGAGRHSPGNTVAAGAAIMDVIPVDGAFLFETRIPPKTKERVHPGQSVSVRVQAPGFYGYSAMSGTLTKISPSIFSDSRGKEFYKGTIALDRVADAKRSILARLLPGMAIEADIKISSRRLFQIF
ncbi:MAG: HlyD family type I secretion periplasmic adaptor subunit [Rhodospirillales bacterium]|nr:HlyD family type I secretion periplasmic adaptor subunit [Rhodospirillales bacterium]